MLSEKNPDINSLVEKHSQRVFNLAFRVTGNRQDAEDVVQETFLRVFQGLAGFRGESDIGTWIHRMPWFAPVAREVFGGKFDPATLRFPMNLIPALKKMFSSDIRNWDAIRAWANRLPTGSA